MKNLWRMALLALALSLSCAKEPAKGPIIVEQPLVIQADSRIPKLVSFVSKTNPALSDSDAVFIARTLEDIAKEYDLDLATFAAVIRQESHFRLNLRVCYGYPPRCDLGLGQISQTWVKAWNLDPMRLRYDIHYNLDVAAKILKHMKKSNPKDEKAYSRYHNNKPTLRKDYENRVEKWRLLALR